MAFLPILIDGGRAPDSYIAILRKASGGKPLVANLLTWLSVSPHTGLAGGEEGDWLSKAATCTFLAPKLPACYLHHGRIQRWRFSLRSSLS